jgi:hypothetical protein
MLQDYDKEDAMFDDKAFERLLKSYTKHLVPLLTAILEDRRLPAIYAEQMHTAQGVPPAMRIFADGALLPYSLLLLIKRGEVYHDTELMLPFWYSFPILTPTFSFFRHLWRKPTTSASVLFDEV